LPSFSASVYTQVAQKEPKSATFQVESRIILIVVKDLLKACQPKPKSIILSMTLN